MSVFKGMRVAADEIFILVLIVVCVGTLVATGVRSRRNNKAAAKPEATTLQEGTATTEPPSTEPVRSDNANRRKRRTRRAANV